jgi:hypothetical protein
MSDKIDRIKKLATGPHSTKGRVPPRRPVKPNPPPKGQGGSGSSGGAGGSGNSPKESK